MCYMQLSKVTSSIYKYTVVVCIIHTCIYLYVHIRVSKPSVQELSGLMETLLLVIQWFKWLRYASSHVLRGSASTLLDSSEDS